MPASDPIQSITRAMSMVKLVSASDDGLTLQQLSDLLQLKPPTVHHIARTLQSGGFLDKLNKPIRYVLGPALVDMADRHGQRGLLRRAQVAMHQVSEQLDGALVSIAESIGGDIVMSQRVVSNATGLVQQPRHAMSPYVTVSALLFQAYWADDERDGYQKQYPFDEFGASQWGTKQALSAFLSEARHRGYAALNIEPPGFRVAVPIFSKRGVMVAALGAYVTGKGPDEKPIPLPDIIDCLNDAVRDIQTEVKQDQVLDSEAVDQV